MIRTTDISEGATTCEKLISLVVEALEQAGKTVKKTSSGYQAQCPVHNDRNPSLTISQGDDGRILLCCHAGCKVKDICRALGITEAELFPDKRAYNPKNDRREKTKRVYPTLDDAIEEIAQQVQGTYTNRWTYYYADGCEALIIARYDDCPNGSKEYRPLHHNGIGYVRGDPLGPLPLYQLSELNGAAKVFIVEGEKCVDAAKSIGLVATTSAHGSNAAHKTDWTPLASKDVVILPDNDNPGRQYAEDVAEILCQLNPPATVRIVNIPGLSGGQDIADYIEQRDAVESETLRENIKNWTENLPYITARTNPDTTLKSNRPSPVESAKNNAPWMCSDMGNADRLVYYHGDKLRYCAPWGKWLIWDGNRWRPDDSTRILHYAKQTALRLWDKCKAIGETSIGKCNDLTKWAAKSQQRDRLSAMADLARCEVAVTPEQLDTDPWLLNCLNGTIDLRTGRLRPHRQTDMISKLAPVRYDDQAECPRWTAFLDRIMDGSDNLIGYLQRIAGLCLTADIREQILPIFYGTGANGKSVFLDTLLGIMGDYGIEAAPGLLILKQGYSEHPTEIADLAGRRLVVGWETEEGQHLRIQLIKRLTGNAKIKARYMRQDYFEFDRTFKVILCTNNKPSVQEQTVAVWRRLRLIPFNVTIPENEQDKSLLHKLKCEWSGILRWAVQGCLA